ncbi:CHAT domain-containing protein [Plectonema cf. radiosum LEGE 06105]|uniref:CHAT domain-containing protein n=1 Tax=Plectonema cf. radiosum LEGE 06105 TaxID=945769 RepID=A0A8J7F8Y9_9CYAN|nr:CHAT domain-containing protein [Plectonema radiosum]MBE9216485.1 CHAT domain-containing protein [Plectonema cf. radiosum LEGE 06105]
MRYQKWLSTIILFALAVLFTFIPVLAPKADAEYIYQDIYDSTYIAQNEINPQNLLDKGKILHDAGKFNDAIAVLKQAVQVFKNQGNQIKQAIALSNLSLTYKQIGEYQQALSYIIQSRTLLENQPDYQQSKHKLQVFAQIIDIQANLQLTLGKPLLALDNWKQATTIYQRVNFKDEKIRSLINQNLALQALGRYRQAHKILAELLPELDKQPASMIKVTALRSFGDVQLHLGEIDASLNTLQQSYKIAQEIKLNFNFNEYNTQISEILLSLGNAQRAKGNRLHYRLQNTTNFAKIAPLFYVSKPISPEVRKLYQQAVKTYEKTINISTLPVIKVKAQLNLLSILIELEEFLNAGKLYSQLQLIIDKLPISETSINSRIHLAENLLFLKQISPNNAPEWQDIAQIIAVAIKQAEILEDTRLQSYGMGVLGSVYLQTNNLNYAQQLSEKAVNLALAIDAKDIAYLWQWQLGYIYKVQNNITESLNYYSQAVNNINDLRSDLLILHPDIQFSFRDNVEPVYRQLVDLLLQSPNFQNINQTNLNQKNLKQARDVIEALQLREIENYFQEACLQAKPEIIDTVVDQSDTTAAVIYPIILENRLEIILKLPNQNQFNHYTTFIPANEVEETLEKLQYSLRQPEQINQVKKISAKVYNWLIRPLEVDLEKHNIETLVFVLDGNFKNIPMAVLYDNNVSGKAPKYLIEKYAIALTPGLQMLKPKPLQQQDLNILMAGVTEKRLIENKEFNPLINVQFELQKIQSQIPNNKKLLNQSFTDINLEKQINSAKYTVVHIATHGNFSSNLEETYILAWNKLLKLKDLERLFQINTNTDSQTIQLLVLSACQTADGDKRATLGLSGIAIRAGARSTLATLWAVEDKSTAEFMSQFYQELLNNKFNKVKALQQAQIKLLKNTELPMIWSPYVLIGNWL